MNNESTTAFVNVGRGRAIHYARVYKYKDPNETTYYHVLCDGNVSDVRPARRQVVTCLRCKRALAAIPNFKG